MNSFFGLGPMELALIVFIALIVLGPERLPGAIREVMKYWKYFRNLSGELTSQFSEELQGLDDLNPQKILQDLAAELDDEVEQTKEAAGIKKPAAKKKTTSPKKTATKKTATKKTTTAKKTSSSTAKKSDAPVIAAATGAAAVSAKTNDADDAESMAEDEEQKEGASTSGQDGQTPAQGGDMPATADAAEPAATSENTILPPAGTVESAASEQAASEQAGDDGQQTETAAVEQGAGSDAPANSGGGKVDEADETGGAPAAKNTIGPAEPTPIGVNGKGVRPEDE